VKHWAKRHFAVCLEVDEFDEAERNSLMDQLKKRSIDSRPFLYDVVIADVQAKAITGGST